MNWFTKWFAAEEKQPEKKDLPAIGQIVSKAGSWEYTAFWDRPYNPDFLYKKGGGYRHFDEIREDDQVGAVLRLKKHMILGRGWDFEIVEDDEEEQAAQALAMGEAPPEEGKPGEEKKMPMKPGEQKMPMKKPMKPMEDKMGEGGEEEKPYGVAGKEKPPVDPQQLEIKRFLKYCLTDGLNKPFDDSLFQFLSALDFGFSISEKVYKLIEEGQYKDKICYESFRTRPPHGIILHTTEKGDLEKIMQDDTELKPIEKFIIYIHNQEFENIYGRSDIDRGVYRAWWAKNNIIKFWNIYLERFGMPTAVGRYGPASSEADRSRLLTILDRLTAKGATVLPEDMKLEFLEVVKDSGSGYERAVDKMNIAIARAIMVPDLIGMSGEQTSGGSFALGEMQFQLFYTILEKERTYLERLVNKEIVEPLLRMNYGMSPEDAKVRFKLNPMNEDDKTAMVKAWSEMVRAVGFKPNPEEINWARKLLGAPEGLVMDKPEPLLQAGMDPKTGKPMEPPEEGEKPKGKAPAPEKPGAKSFAFHPSRELTSYEHKCDFEFISSETKAQEASLKRELYKVTNLAITDLADWIVKKKVVESKKIELATSPEVKYENQFRVALKAGLKDAYRLGQLTANMELGHTMPFALAGLSDTEVQKLIDEIATYVSHTEWENIRKKTTPILQNAIQNGVPLRQVMKELDEALKDYDMTFEPPAPFKGTTAARLENIVRTNYNDVFNEARKNEFIKYENEIAAFIFSGVADDRQSEICRELDGLIFGKEDLNKYTPPLHYQCRSVVVPILKGEEYTLSDMPVTKEQPGGFLTLAGD